MLLNLIFLGSFLVLVASLYILSNKIFFSRKVWKFLPFFMMVFLQMLKINLFYSGFEVREFWGWFNWVELVFVCIIAVIIVDWIRRDSKNG